MDSLLSQPEFQKIHKKVRGIAGQINAKTDNQSYLEEFVQVGWCGVMEALKNHRLGGKVFGNYVAVKVKGAIRDYQRKTDPMKRYQRARFKILTNARMKLQQKLTRDPTSNEVFKETGIHEFVDILVEEYQDQSYFIEPYNVKLAVSKLPDVEQRIIKLMYYEQYEGREIADYMGWNPAKVSLIHTSALKKLREDLQHGT